MTTMPYPCGRWPIAATFLLGGLAVAACAQAARRSSSDSAGVNVTLVRKEFSIQSHSFPMWRVERISRDESTDDLPSMSDQFEARTGRRLEHQ